MLETQATIVEWARTTFGEKALDQRKIAARCGKEVSELLYKVATNVTGQEIVDECADIAVMMSQVAELRGIDMKREGGGTTFAAEEHWPLIVAGEITTCYGELFGKLHYEQSDGYEASIYGDLWSSLERLVALQNLAENLDEVRDRKMQINRARKWATAPDGRSQHVEGT